MQRTAEATQPHNADHLSQRNFQRLAAYIESYSGIKMPPSKITMMEGRLRKRVRATGLPSLGRYCDYLFNEDGLAKESVELINVVTTNKTEFFREPEHFRYLVDHAVPQLVRQRGTQAPLNIWSAAASIGAEAYTIAMVLADLANRIGGLRYVITATDLSTDVLKTARCGIYPEAMITPVPADFRRRYVLRSKNRARQEVRIAPELRARVQFARVNLMETPYPIAVEMDIIFCRNILIYFDKATQEAVLLRLIEHLRPGGYLFLGHSESLAGFHLPLRAVVPTVFRRVPGSP